VRRSNLYHNAHLALTGAEIASQTTLAMTA